MARQMVPVPAVRAILTVRAIPTVRANPAFLILGGMLVILFGWVAPVWSMPIESIETGESFFQWQSLIAGFLSQIQQWGILGGLAFILLYGIATVALIPGSLLTLGAGAVYGLGLGSLYVFLGASLGAVLAFSIGRYWVRDWVAAKIETMPQFQAIDAAIGQAGFKIVVLCRLSPVFPFTLLNYALGITQVSLRDYTLGCIGMLPGTLLYVYLGSIASGLVQIGAVSADEPVALQWFTRGVGFLATIAVTVYITRIARRALEQIDSQT